MSTMYIDPNECIWMTVKKQKKKKKIVASWSTCAYGMTKKTNLRSTQPLPHTHQVVGEEGDLRQQ